MKITLMGETMCPSFVLQPHSTVVVAANNQGHFGVTFKVGGELPGEKYRSLLRVQPVWLEDAKLVSPQFCAVKVSGCILLHPDDEHVLLIIERGKMHEYKFQSVPAVSA